MKNKQLKIGDLNEAVDAVLKGVDKMFQEQKDINTAKFSAIERRFDNLDDRLDSQSKKFDQYDREISSLKSRIRVITS